MSNTKNGWITVKKHKSKKTKNKINNTTISKFYNVKNKPKLNNLVKEKILKYCEIKEDDYPIFNTWMHFYIMGNITKDNQIFRIENNLLILEYVNKFKVYKNYKKGTEEEFKIILSKIKMNTDILLNEMKENNLYYNNELLQNHTLFKNIYKYSKNIN